MTEFRSEFSDKLSEYLREQWDAAEQGPWAGMPPTGAERAIARYLDLDQPAAWKLPQVTVTKASGWVPVSDGLAMDAGAIPDTRPRAPLRKRLRWKAAAARERAARRAYKLISGDWPYEPDPYDE